MKYPLGYIPQGDYRIRRVRGFEATYCVTDSGRIWSIPRAFMRKNRGGNGFDIVCRGGWISGTKSFKKNGRLSCVNACLTSRDKRSILKLHRVVLETFVGLRPDGHECCHWDGNPLNNNLSNLRYDSSSKNKLDALRHGTSYVQVLSEYDVAYIKFLLEHTRIMHREIADMFAVSRGTITNINNGKTWGHVKPLQPMA